MKGNNIGMSSKKKLTKEIGQCTLSEFEFTRSELPTWSVKQRTPPSAEKPDSKRINMSNPEPGHSTETVAFDFAAMEQWIIASYRESIKQEVSEALKPLESQIDELLQIKTKTDKISGEVKKLKQENKTIERRCNLVERENKTLKDRLNSIESKMLESHVIMHGVEEIEDKNSNQRIDKVKEILSYTVNKPTPEEQLNEAINIPIVSTSRLGHYSENRNRPISITFENKSDSNFLLKQKKKLPEGVFVDREYCSETEKEQQFLWPVLKEARKMKSFVGNVKWMDQPWCYRERNTPMKTYINFLKN